MKHIYTLILLCTVQFAHAQQWTPQGPGLPLGYGVYSISVVDDTVIWCTAGPQSYSKNHPAIIFRSVDAGESWTVRNTDFGIVTCINCRFARIEAVSASTAWMTTYDGVGKLYKTEDGGQHWSLKLTNEAAGGHIEIYNENFMTCRLKDDIAWSADGGESWELGTVSVNLDDRFPYTEGLDEVFGDTAWYGMGGSAYFGQNDISARLIRTTQYGRNITFIDCDLDSIASIGMISFGDHLHGMMKYTIWVQGYDYDMNWGNLYSDTDDVAVSSDGGDTWNRIICPIRKVSSILSVPHAAHVLFAAGESEIALSKDHGKTWTSQMLPYEVSCIDFSSPGAGWIAVNGSEGNNPLVLKWSEDFSSGVKEHPVDSYAPINVFPNPARDIIYISIDTISLQHETITLTDATGQVVIKSQTRQQELNVAHLPAGVYYLQVKNQDSAGLARIIKH